MKRYFQKSKVTMAVILEKINPLQDRLWYSRIMKKGVKLQPTNLTAGTISYLNQIQFANKWRHSRPYLKRIITSG